MTGKSWIHNCSLRTHLFFASKADPYPKFSVGIMSPPLSPQGLRQEFTNGSTLRRYCAAEGCTRTCHHCRARAHRKRWRQTTYVEIDRKKEDEVTKRQTALGRKANNGFGEFHEALLVAGCTYGKICTRILILGHSPRVDINPPPTTPYSTQCAWTNASSQASSWLPEQPSLIGSRCATPTERDLST